MKPRLIKRQTIEDYAFRNARSRIYFQEYLEKLKHADWERPEDIKKTYRAADILGESSNRIAFNIGGNHYRMICKYHFGDRQVHLFICWIGSHAEYTTLCDEQLQYTISNY